VSLLDALIWGHELETVSSQLSPSSPSSPSSPARIPTELQLRSSPSSWNDLSDGYECRANAALKAIREIAAPEGLIVWLGTHSPLLYGRLNRDLPNKISRAWNAHVPHEEFDALCFDWVETFRRAAEVYKLARDARKLGKSP
jgi:hypothetical protein